MKKISLSDLDLLDFGNTIQLWGCIYSGQGQMLIVPFPDEDTQFDFDMFKVLDLGAPQWEMLLRQTDELNVRMGPTKAIIRKSQRQIDSNISWAVFKRDGYRCRYCGEEKPLTVDHVDLWEDGGTSIEANLISACRRCNKLRGNVQYEAWVTSEDYKRVSKKLSPAALQANWAVVSTLDGLRKLRTAKQRSR